MFHNKMKKILLYICISCISVCGAYAQINTAQVLNVGRNALYFEDYVLSIQYFNQVIKIKPYLAEPYFYRAVAKINLEDYKGAEEDCTKALEINPFITDAYQVRGIARQTLRKNKEAIEDYTKGLKMMPEDKALLFNKAVCEEAEKEFDASEETYKKLLKLYPNDGRSYLGRAQLRLAKGDSVAAVEDINKSIELYRNNAVAYVMRADVKMRKDNDYESALIDMDEAIKLEPHYAGYFVNRAYMKYHLDDYFGAMADYNYAVELDPTSVTARFNRGLMLTEVSENNKAIADFSYVLRSEPDNFLARYNRALLYSKTGQYKKAIADYDVVLEKYPDFEAGLFARSECKRKMGDLVGGERDYNRSRELYKKKKKIAEYDESKDAEQANEEVESESAVMNKFSTLLTDNTESKIKPKYENKTRGRVQDSNVQIDPEAQFMLTYYNNSNKLHETTNYMREINEVNESHYLPFTMTLSNVETKLQENSIEKHFSSIEYYNGLLATSKPRSIDYFARGMDFMMVKNCEAAIADFDKAIASSPKFALAYFARANARFMYYEIEKMKQMNVHSSNNMEEQAQRMVQVQKGNSELMNVISDYEETIALSPKNVYALFNLGNIHLLMKNNTEAISCYTKAIEAKQDFGEAYYNRGLVYLQLGNKDKGLTDLSKAGELGVLPSYNVLKRMSN